MNRNFVLTIISRFFSHLLGFTVAAGIALVLCAQTQVANADSLADWFAQPTMTGNWGGIRTSLQNAGITPYANTIDSGAYNFSGGTSPGGSVAQQYSFGANFDLGKLLGIDGGILHVSLSYRAGTNTSTAHIAGNPFQVQDVFGAGENFRLARLAYQQKFDQGKIVTELGFFPEADNYNSIVVWCHFLNFSLCGHNTAFNSGVSINPTGHWGGNLRVYLIPNFYVESGVWAVNPEYNLPSHGFDVSLDDTSGALLPIEFGWSPNVGPDHLPGHYRIGGYYDTSTVQDNALPSSERHGRYGGYIAGDQMLFSLEPGTNRGLIALSEVVVGDSRTSLMPLTYNFGLILQGPLASRPNDYIDLGTGFGSVNNRSRLEAQIKNTTDPVNLADFEQLGTQVVEFGYGAQIAPWLLLYPNVQYIGDPGAFAFKDIPEAWVFATRLTVTF
jgi:porin